MTTETEQIASTRIVNTHRTYVNDDTTFMSEKERIAGRRRTNRTELQPPVDQVGEIQYGTSNIEEIGASLQGNEHANFLLDVIDSEETGYMEEAFPSSVLNHDHRKLEHPNSAKDEASDHQGSCEAPALQRRSVITQPTQCMVHLPFLGQQTLTHLSADQLMQQTAIRGGKATPKDTKPLKDVAPVVHCFAFWEAEVVLRLLKLLELPRVP